MSDIQDLRDDSDAIASANLHRGCPASTLDLGRTRRSRTATTVPPRARMTKFWKVWARLGRTNYAPIGAALERIAKGTYGICVHCGAADFQEAPRRRAVRPALRGLHAARRVVWRGCSTVPRSMDNRFAIALCCRPFRCHDRHGSNKGVVHGRSSTESAGLMINTS